MVWFDGFHRSECYALFSAPLALRKKVTGSIDGIGERGLALPRGDILAHVIGVAVFSHDCAAGHGGGDAGEGTIRGVAVNGGRVHGQQ